MNRFEYGKKITIYGSQKDINYAKDELDALTIPEREADARIILQNLIDDKKLNADIMFDGNGITRFNKIIKNVKTILAHNDMNKMSDYLYEFLHLDCGSIAHYNKDGWISTYPTVDDLRSFFLHNEFGKKVSEDLPEWKTDAIRIVHEIEKLLKLNEEEKRTLTFAFHHAKELLIEGLLIKTLIESITKEIGPQWTIESYEPIIHIKVTAKKTILGKEAKNNEEIQY